MDDSFDQEFYRSEWQRVLPLGPDGIQPYVRGSRAGRLPGMLPDLDRLIAAWGTAAQRVIAFARFAATSVAKRPMLLASAPRASRQRLATHRSAHEAARPVVRHTAATRRRSSAA